MLKMNIGKNIIAYRKANGLTQQQLADVLEVSNRTISSWELNRTEPQIADVEKMCSLFNCSRLDLLSSEVLTTENYGDNIRSIRMKKGLSQGYLAKAIGVSNQCVSLWENNKRNFDIATAKKISDILECNINEITNNGDDEEYTILENIYELQEMANNVGTNVKGLQYLINRAIDSTSCDDAERYMYMLINNVLNDATDLINIILGSNK